MTWYARILTGSRGAEKYLSLDESQRYLIGIAGIPGSGKTTFAASLAYHLNTLYSQYYLKKYPNAADFNVTRTRSHREGVFHHRNSSDSNTTRDIAFVLPMDGYHLTRAQLSAMPNSEEAHYRRGAAFTFDADNYFKLIEKLRKPIEPGSRTIWAPSFDHAAKDPVENDISIPRTARVVIIEGLYVGLTYPPSKGEGLDTDAKEHSRTRWTQSCELLDEVWLISVSIPTATERVAKRNFKAGLSPSLEAALKRTIENDMENAREILDHLPGEEKLTEKIESVEDAGWKSEEQRHEIDAEKARLEEEERERDIQRLRLERMGSIAEMADAGAGM